MITVFIIGVCLGVGGTLHFLSPEFNRRRRHIKTLRETCDQHQDINNKQTRDIMELHRELSAESAARERHEKTLRRYGLL
jgi:hypothetical protein